ncbi:protein Mdm4 isoform X1 [Alosa sapidissima]|uniref:protein Mdm4 isoform X1 n=1 Tax=Alosa sapidissima TaxID=34773 RepID=UPI001C0A516F|nr:protein Mdm4 isoform X1 [Alosa sapidissima]
MTSFSANPYSGSNASCRSLPGEGSQVQPKAPLLQILREAGAQEDVFTLKEVMHYLGQYIMAKQLYDKQRQHIVHCQDDPLGELLEVDSFSVKNPSPVYEMLKKNLFVLNCADAAKNLSVGKDSSESASDDPGQVPSSLCRLGLGLGVFGAAAAAGCPSQTTSQRRPREMDEDSLDGLPRSACKRPKLDVSLDEWDLSGLPWWFLGNLRSNYSRKSNGSTDIHTNQISPGQEEDTAIVSDTTDDLWFLNEAESEQVSVEMKEAALEQGSDAESPPEDEEGNNTSATKDKEMSEELDEDSQCLSDDTDTEISIQDAWQCTECRKFNTPLQRYCVRCWAMQKDWYRGCPRLAHSLSVPDIPACSGRPLKCPGNQGQDDEEDDDDDDDEEGLDVPDCMRTISDPVILPSHVAARDCPRPSSSKGKGPRRLPPSAEALFREGGESSEGDSQDTLLDEEMAATCQKDLLEPCKLCRVRPRNGNIIHGRTAHMLTCFPCARKLHKFHAPCPGCGQIIQKVIKTFIA